MSAHTEQRKSGEIRDLADEGGILSHPFFSWDSQEVGYLRRTRELAAYDDSTSKVRSIGFYDLTFASFLGGAWGPNGEIVLATQGRPLRVVRGAGNTEDLTTLSPGETQAFPQFLPDGRHVLFVSTQDNTEPDRGSVEVVNVVTKERHWKADEILLMEHRDEGPDKLQVLTREDAIVGRPVWDWDGGAVFYIGKRGSTNGVWKLDPSALNRTDAETEMFSLLTVRFHFFQQPKESVPVDRSNP